MILWEHQKLFKKNSADKITNFNPSRHALIIDCPSFGIDSSATVTFAEDRLSFRQSIQKDNQFVYYKKNGGLYFNENKSLNGFGDGGIIAILKGAPDLTSENIDFLWCWYKGESYLYSDNDMSKSFSCISG